jgi:hypothetical protein
MLNHVFIYLKKNNMIKNIIFLVFLLFGCNQINAQQTTFEFGEIDSKDKIMPYKIIGEDKTDFIVVCKPRNIRYYDNYVSSILKDIIGYAEYSIALVNKSTLSISKIMALPLFKAELITNKSNPFIHGMFLRGDTLSVLTSTWDKAQKDYAMHVWNLNYNSLEPFTSEAKLITRIPDNGKDIFEKIIVKQFDKTREIAIIYPIIRKAAKSKVLNFVRLNSEFNLLKKDSIIYRDDQHWLGIKNIEADSAGNIFVLSGFSEVSSPDWDDSSWLGLQMIPAIGELTSTLNIKTKVGNAFNGNICLNSSGELFVCGYYSGMTKSKDGERELIGGSFIAKIRPQTGEVLKVDEKELTENQKKAIRLPYSAVNNIKLSYSRINELKVMNIFFDDEDNILMVGVSENSNIYMLSSGNRNTNTTLYESNSILTSKFSNSGDVIWQTITPKSSMTSDFAGMLDPIVHFDKGTIMLFFNDHIKNIAVMNSLASGENTDSYSSYSSSERVTPVDLPPSDSDETSDYSIWQEDNTILRKTIIDSTGKWKVSWIDLETSKENKKNAILEGSLLYIDSEGNIISCIYPKYGAFTKAQNAVIVKISN